MIVVKIELWKKGNPDDVNTLGVMYVTNTGAHPGHPKKGHYIAQLLRKPSFNVIHKSATLDDWPRLDKTVWQMLLAILQRMYP